MKNLIFGLCLVSGLVFAQTKAPAAPGALNTGTNSGDVTIGTGNGLSLAGQALSITTYTGAVNGTTIAGSTGTFTGGISADGGTFTDTVTSTIADGGRAIQLSSGQMLDLGGGASDQLVSNGTTVSMLAAFSTGTITTAGNINLNTNGTSSIVSLSNAASMTSTVAGTAIVTNVTPDANDLILEVGPTTSSNVFTVDAEGDGTAHALTTTLAGSTNSISIPTSSGISFNGDAVGTSVTGGSSMLVDDASDFIYYYGNQARMKINRVSGDMNLLLGLGTPKISMGGNLVFSNTAPTVTSACTSPTITHGRAASFKMDVGGSCAATTTVVLGLPTASNGWSCNGYNASNALATIEQSADSATSATLINYTRTTGVALAFTDGNDLVISCIAR